MEKLVFVANPFKLSPAQLKSVAEFARDTAQIIVGSTVITPLVIGEVKLITLIIGLTLTTLFWYGNLVIVRRLEL